MGAALGLFFIGGLLTTVAPPLVDKSWGMPFENHDSAKGPPASCDYTAQEKRGYDLRPRRLLVLPHPADAHAWSDTNRSGWSGVDSPVSTPDEFVYDYKHTVRHQTHRSRSFPCGGKYDTEWHRTHFRNPRDLVPGSIMPPFPWIAEKPEEFTALVAYLQTLGRAKDWRPDNDYENEASS